MTHLRKLRWRRTSTVTEQNLAPRLGRAGDAGLDLTVAYPMVLIPGATRDISAGIAVAFPDDVWGLIVGRSSTLRKRGLLVNTGVIDTGYRGELFVNVHNMTDQDVWVSAGERLGQLILLPNLASRVEVTEVLDLPPSERGDKGFGSTGL